MATVDIQLRPELEGKRYDLIEFLVARVAEQQPEERDPELVDILTAYQDVEVRIRRSHVVRDPDFEDLMRRSVGYGGICRGYARAWSDHRNFNRGWLAP